MYRNKESGQHTIRNEMYHFKATSPLSVYIQTLAFELNTKHSITKTKTSYRLFPFKTAATLYCSQYVSAKEIFVVNHIFHSQFRDANYVWDQSSATVNKTLVHARHNYLETFGLNSDKSNTTGHLSKCLLT